MQKPILFSIFFCFAGLANAMPKLDFETEAIKITSIGIQGAPLQHGQPLTGVENGPALIRGSGIVNFLKDEGHAVLDYGDIDLGVEVNAASIGADVPINDPDIVAFATWRISNETKNILQQGRFPLTFGGDHALAIGTLNAVSAHYENLTVIYIDAHADINTVASTPSGNLHGMPLSFVIIELAHINANLTQFAWVEPRIPAHNVAHIALRDVDAGEVKTLTDLGMAAFNMRDVDRFGILGVVDMALDRIGGRDRPLYISMDIDSLDDLEIGFNTGTPVPGGLTVREVLSMFQELSRVANIVGFELTEVNPSLGDPSAVPRTAEVCRRIIPCVFGSCFGIHPAPPVEENANENDNTSSANSILFQLDISIIVCFSILVTYLSNFMK